MPFDNVSVVVVTVVLIFDVVFDVVLLYNIVLMFIFGVEPPSTGKEISNAVLLFRGQF